VTDVLLGAILILQGVLIWMQLPKHKVKSGAVSDVLKAALGDAGVNCELPATTNLVHTGKLGEVLFHASMRMDKPIVTLQDLQDLLVKHG
jgi:hypothetical protein